MKAKETNIEVPVKVLLGITCGFRCLKLASAASLLCVCM